MGRQGPIPAKPAQGTADAQDPCASYKPDVGPSYWRSKHQRLAGVKRTFTAEQDTRREIQGAATTSGEKKKRKNTPKQKHPKQTTTLPIFALMTPRLFVKIVTVTVTALKNHLPSSQTPRAAKWHHLKTPRRTAKRMRSDKNTEGTDLEHCRDQNSTNQLIAAW